MTRLGCIPSHIPASITGLLRCCVLCSQFCFFPSLSIKCPPVFQVSDCTLLLPETLMPIHTMSLLSFLQGFSFFLLVIFMMMLRADVTTWVLTRCHTLCAFNALFSSLWLSVYIWEHYLHFESLLFSPLRDWDSFTSDPRDVLLTGLCMWHALSILYEWTVSCGGVSDRLS